MTENDKQDGAYRILDPDLVVRTQQRLHDHIRNRFPDSGLGDVARDLLEVAKQAKIRSNEIHRPDTRLRIAIYAVLSLAVLFLIAIAVQTRVRADLHNATTLVQFADATFGTLVFLGATGIFLFSLETRLKRRRAQTALHELRSLAHVIDMHQVAKHPEGLKRTAGIPQEIAQYSTKTLPDLRRYLQYCIESLAIVSKIAAVYVQNFPDEPTVSAVDEVETLCSGLSQKIWQKLTVLERMIDDHHGA